MTTQIIIEEIPPEELQQAVDEVINTLKKYPIATKIGALHTLINNIPITYDVTTK